MGIKSDILVTQQKIKEIPENKQSMIEALENETDAIKLELEKTNVHPNINSEYLMKMGNYYHLTNQYDKAAQEYEEVLKVDPENKVAKKNKDVTISKFKRIFGSKKRIKNKNVNLISLVNNVELFFKNKKMKTKVFQNTKETEYEIRVIQDSKLKLFYGIGKALTIIIKGDPNDFEIILQSYVMWEASQPPARSHPLFVIKIKSNFWAFIEKQMNVR